MIRKERTMLHYINCAVHLRQPPRRMWGFLGTANKGLRNIGDSAVEWLIGRDARETPPSLREPLYSVVVDERTDDGGADSPVAMRFAL